MTTLERFITTGEIEISNCPDTDKKRLAKLEHGMVWLPCQNVILLKMKVHYPEMSSERFQSYEVILAAEMNCKVDSNFTVVPEPVANEVDGVITNQQEINDYKLLPTEYEAVRNLALTTPAPQLCVTFINLRDSQGKINI